MKFRLLALAALVLAAATAALIKPAAALAHHPEITAEVVCNEATGVASIAFTSTAWAGSGSDPTNDPSRANPQIDILVDGVFATTGAYVAPTYSFSGNVPLPAGAAAGDVIEVRAVAVGTWGNGDTTHESTFVDITVPNFAARRRGAPRRPLHGGGHQVRVGEARVTRGLTIHCDLTLSNNLEVNWGGNQFHMLEHLQTVECSDSDEINEDPPPAPLDTLVGVGTGRYNGVDGYTIEFTMVDYGEPGKDDRMAIKIYKGASVVLNVPLQKLTGGNLQAHYDQPHK